MLRETMRVSQPNNDDIVVLSDEDGNVYLINDTQKEIISYLVSWADNGEEITKLFEECDEVLFIEQYTLDAIINGDYLSTLSPNALRKIMRYAKEV